MRSHKYGKFMSGTRERDRGYLASVFPGRWPRMFGFGSLVAAFLRHDPAPWRTAFFVVVVLTGVLLVTRRRALAKALSGKLWPAESATNAFLLTSQVACAVLWLLISIGSWFNGH